MRRGITLPVKTQRSVQVVEMLRAVTAIIDIFPRVVRPSCVQAVGNGDDSPRPPTLCMFFVRGMLCKVAERGVDYTDSQPQRRLCAYVDHP